MVKTICAILILAFAACCGSKSTAPGANSYLPEAVTKDSIPACMSKMIEEASKEQPPNPPVQIDEYLYNGKKVFLVTAQCCDQFNTAYDEECNRICSPSGGITGKGDMQCNDFSEKAKLVKLVWQQAPAKK